MKSKIREVTNGPHTKELMVSKIREVINGPYDIQLRACGVG